MTSFILSLRDSVSEVRGEGRRRRASNLSVADFGESEMDAESNICLARNDLDDVIDGRIELADM